MGLTNAQKDRLNKLGLLDDRVWLDIIINATEMYLYQFDDVLPVVNLVKQEKLDAHASYHFALECFRIAQDYETSPTSAFSYIKDNPEQYQRFCRG